MTTSGRVVMKVPDTIANELIDRGLAEMAPSSRADAGAIVGTYLTVVGSAGVLVSITQLPESIERLVTWLRREKKPKGEPVTIRIIQEDGSSTTVEFGPGTTEEVIAAALGGFGGKRPAADD